MTTTPAPSTPDGSPRSTGSQAASSVERAFVVLQAVVAADGPVGIRELARRTGLPRSTAARLASTLVDIGMVERTAQASLVPGTALATLSVDGGPVPLLRDRLRPLLTALAECHPENVALAVDDGDAVLYLAQIEAANAVTAPDVEAERHPFHVVAHGLALMAYWPDDRLDRYLARQLAAPTRHSVTDPQLLRDRLRRIRQDGYVWTEEEFDTGVNGVAAVVAADTSTTGPEAAIGYYGPSYRLSPDRHPELAESLVSTIGQHR